MSSAQLSLDLVSAIYQDSGSITNEQLYAALVDAQALTQDQLNETQPVGKDANLVSTTKRKIRWFQQTLKQAGVISKVDGKRGLWQYAGEKKKDLTEVNRQVCVVAFSTDLGVAILGDNINFFKNFDEPIQLCITSPPYPLKKARNYGNEREKEWIEFMVRTLEPILTNLKDGGSIVLNLSNDIFMDKSPARSLYLERLILTLHDELGLSLMDRIPWVNLSKPPGPTYWACVKDTQLCVGWEPILWFTNNPHTVKAGNRNVLEQHKEKHLQLIASGGEQRGTQSYGDGAYTLRDGSFGNATQGKIPKNVIHKGHRCADTQALRAIAKEHGLPTHSATSPTSLADFFLRFLTDKGDLAIDPFGGWFKMALAAERLGRRWASTELMIEHIMAAKYYFQQKG